MDRAGNLNSGGVVDHFQILGTLFDSVVAASVAPNGDSGLNPPSFNYGTPFPTPNGQPGDLGFNTFDAPAGTTAVGTVGAFARVPNWTFNSYFNGTSIAGGRQTFHDAAVDPIIDDFVLPGAINPSFAPTPLPASALSSPTTTTTTSGTTTTTQTTQPTVLPLPLPSKSTVLGGVVSTAHGQEADFAGLDASDTRGVFIGILPSS